jgi:hypothetical protein
VQADAVAAVAPVAAALERMGVSYAIGGSLASSVYGEPRSTNDVDLVADLGEEHVDALVRELGDDFYADPDMIRDAVRRRGSFNVVYRPVVFKVDVFVARRDAWTREELARATAIEIDLGDGTRVRLCIASAEDTVLHKLVWYQLGGGVSDRQWADLLGVLRVQAAGLDAAYLDRIAGDMGVADLLARARREAAGT